MESVPAFDRIGRTTEKSLRIQPGDEVAPRAENGDREDEECIQLETAASSLEPYMIRAKLRFDIVSLPAEVKYVQLPSFDDALDFNG